MGCDSKEENKDFSDELWKTHFYNKTKQFKNETIFKLANDSLRNWQRHLPYWKGDTTLGKSILDSNVCINSNSDKAIMVLLGQALKNDNKLDAIGYFYGVKIKEKWYFFSGPTIFIPRKNLSVPSPFPMLHEIAMKEVFSGYLKKNTKGEWEINEAFFSDIDRVLAIHKGKFKTEAEWEKWWTKTVTEVNWSKRDTVSNTLQ